MSETKKNNSHFLSRVLCRQEVCKNNSLVTLRVGDFDRQNEV